MQRRRALMGAQKPPGEQWDYIWDYTDGMPEDNGATKVTNGSQTVQMTSDGLAISTGTGGYVAYRFPDYQSANGTIEVEFIMPLNPASGQNIRLCYSNGSSGFQTQATNGNITPMGSNTPSASALQKQINTERVTWSNSKGAFWLNGNLVGENLRSTQYSSNTQIMIQQTYSKTIIVKAIRIRKE